MISAAPPREAPSQKEKVRRVCNAAAKHQSVSLNDMLMTGPDLLQKLLAVLFKFRQHKWAMTADIESMFLQVGVDKSDQRLLQFLLRADPQDAIGVFQYTRHIFGAKSSPTCANFALQQCAKDKSDQSVVAKVIMENFYMDNLLVSCENEQELMEIKDGLSSVLQRGDFTLTKWVNNARPQEEVAKEDTELRQVIILGIQWNVGVDKLQLCRGLVQKRKDLWTQIAILSVVSSVYDPLGCFAPFTVVARLILKEIWTSHFQRGDDPVCEDVSERFNNWISQLDEINTVNISRPYETTLKDINTGNCTFLPTLLNLLFSSCLFSNESGVESSFIMGKSRVAPQKFLTIPKLELVAAVSAVRLKNLIVEEHDYVIG